MMMPSGNSETVLTVTYTNNCVLFFASSALYYFLNNANTEVLSTENKSCVSGEVTEENTGMDLLP